MFVLVVVSVSFGLSLSDIFLESSAHLPEILTTAKRLGHAHSLHSSLKQLSSLTGLLNQPSWYIGG
jgi:hypothetical protein